MLCITGERLCSCDNIFLPHQPHGLSSAFWYGPHPRYDHVTKLIICAENKCPISGRFGSRHRGSKPRYRPFRMSGGIQCSQSSDLFRRMQIYSLAVLDIDTTHIMVSSRSEMGQFGNSLLNLDSDRDVAWHRRK
jgi:hypothetical protein